MSEVKSLLIQAVQFQRTKDSDIERGIMINNDTLIVDMNGAPVLRSVWKIHILTHELTFYYREPQPWICNRLGMSANQ